MEDKEKDEIYREFNDKVNMSPKELEEWLQTDEAKSSGQGSERGKSTGYQSGEKIVRIKHKKKAELSESDYKHMQKVNGYIARHRAQQPDKDIQTSTWRYSLKNWGHDPCKEINC